MKNGGDGMKQLSVRGARWVIVNISVSFSVSYETWRWRSEGACKAGWASGTEKCT